MAKKKSPPAAHPSAAATMFGDPGTAEFGRPDGGWRLDAYRIIFESDTPAGRLFDLVLIWVVIASVALVVIESLPGVRESQAFWLNWFEYLFTGLFTAEYLLRLACVKRPLRYATSFFGIVDLLAVLPTYLALFVPELYALVDVRILRLLRVFRILKLHAYIAEYVMLLRALRASARKIMVFLSAVLMVVVIMGTVMYVVEGPGNGFTSIPLSIYWAITTVTTVGFGDITPKTDLGRAIASLMMLLGWGVLAVPTGIVTAEMSAQRFLPPSDDRRCGDCGGGGHQADARHCRHCGFKLPTLE